MIGRSGRTRSGELRTWVFTFAAWGSLTVLWSLSVGMGGSPDEPAHIVKAVAVADLQFDTAVRWGEGGFDSSVPRTEVRVPRAYSKLHRDRTCWTGDTTAAASCMPLDPSTDEVAASTYVGTYPPTYYLVVGLPSRVASPPGSLYAMRVVSALLTAAFLTEATLAVRRSGRSGAGAAAMALAVPASVLFLGSTVNPNGLEAAAALCLWATAISSAVDSRQPRMRSLVSLAISALTLSWLRPLGPAYAVVILAVAFGTFATVPVFRSLWASLRVRLLIVGLALSGVAAVAFALVNSSFTSLITYEGAGDRSAVEAATAAVGDLGAHLLRAWGLLGWQGTNTFTVPFWITIPWLSLVGALVVSTLIFGRWRTRLGVALLTLGCVVGPVAPTVLSRGTPWQGRYMLPLLVGIPLVAVAVLERSLDPARIRFLGRLARPVVAFCALALLVSHQHLMNRTVVGLPARPLANLTSGTWHGPLTPPILCLWAVTASTLWAVNMLAIRWDGSDPAAPASPEPPPRQVA